MAGMPSSADAAAERGEVVRRALPPAEKLLEAAGEAKLLLRRDGDGAAESVDDHAGVRDALGRELALLIAETQTEVVGEAVPAGLRAPCDRRRGSRR